MSGKITRGLAALAALAIVAAASPADAAFMITITEVTTGQTVTIMDGDANDSNLNVGQIGYSTPAMSPFTDFDIVGLSAASNRTAGSGTSAVLAVNGSAIRNTSTPNAPVVLQIDLTDSDYINPTPGPFILKSSASSVFTNTGGGDSRTFQSFGDDANAMGGMTTPSPILTFVDNRPPFLGVPRSFSGNAAYTPFPGDVPFSLTNRTILTVGPSRTTPPIALRRIQFSGSTSALAIPEPASLTLLAVGGLGLFGVARRRKAKVVEA